jgi:AcrR family transcriptional regulator
LPVIDVGVVHERADAARNRLRVLEAAGRLFAERGVSGVTMDDIALGAGVGKGTLYRRFVDKGGLAVALIDERERELQQQILSGPPPLGPGDAAIHRLDAFVVAYLRFLERDLELVLLSETSTPGARLRTGAHNFWRQHCRYLLDQQGAPDPDLRAQVLLAALSADQVQHWLRDESRDREALTRALVAAAIALANT